MDPVHAIAGGCEFTGTIHGDSYVLGDAVAGGSPDASVQLFQATHTRVPGAYTLVLFSDDLKRAPEVVRDIEREIRLGSLLRHPRIAQTFDFGQGDQSPPFVVLEPLAGRSLADVMRLDGMMSLATVVGVVGQIVDALEAAHALKVFHGHLHPGLIWLTDGSASGSPRVTVLGFGWARLARAHAVSRAHAAGPGGDSSYVAPEQRGSMNSVGADLLDERADQFSLASIAYEMLAGCLPFSDENSAAGDGANAGDVLAPRPLSAAPTPFSDVVVGLPQGLDEPFRRALSFVPVERFDRLRDFVDALRAVLQDKIGQAALGDVATPLPRYGIAALPTGPLGQPAGEPASMFAPALMLPPPKTGSTAAFWAEAGQSWGLPQVGARSSTETGSGAERDPRKTTLIEGPVEASTPPVAVPFLMATPPTWPIDGEQRVPDAIPSTLTLRSRTRLPPYINLLFAAAAVAVVIGAVSEMSNKRATRPAAAVPSIKAVAHATPASTPGSSSSPVPANPRSGDGTDQAVTSSGAGKPPSAAGTAPVAGATPTEAILVGGDSRRDRVSAPRDVRRSAAARRHKPRRTVTSRK